ncbi:MAG: endonuclease III [Spirochaetaceae bacterium]|nr:endonuclease III [Spirochaetaceae bacterium]
MIDKEWEALFNRMSQKLSDLDKPLPAVSLIAQESNNDPFLVLISTLLSLRTKDKVTLEASRRLFKLAKTPNDMLGLTTEQLEQAIYPCCFFRRKSENIKKISTILIENYEGKVPSTKEELMRLPGIGIKTANLTLNLGFAIKAICVDCHVHQIANRMGWIDTETPEKSELELQRVMPKRFWIPLNELLVSYGQSVCTSVSPKCSICSENNTCPKKGVKNQR